MNSRSDQRAADLLFKPARPYAVDSVLAIDVSRLGWAGRWFADPSRTTIFGQVLDECDWGPLKGIILFRSPNVRPCQPHSATLRSALRTRRWMAAVVAALLVAAWTVISSAVRQTWSIFHSYS